MTGRSLSSESRVRPFAVTWSIWLLGYAMLLAADFTVRGLPGGEHGLAPLPLVVTATVLGGAACGYFLASARRWPMMHRLLLLVLQIPLAYGTAVLLGMTYLCMTGERCL